MKIFQFDSFDTTLAVLPDGTITLPRIGSLQVWGLTLDQAREQITKGYKRILRQPVVYIDLIRTRPIRVTVSGEVQRPGIYSLGLSEASQLMNTDGGEGSVIRSQGWPTLVEAIQKAGGITASGDLRRVTLVRPARDRRNTTTIEVDFWEALKTGQPISNPLIYDGDSIRIPVAESQPESEQLAIAGSSFSPPSITVNVVGEVVRPGPQKVKANSPLSQAVLSAGGINLRGSKSSVELLRLLPNGTVERRILAYDPAAPLGNQSNPAMRDGDVIVVDRHAWSKFHDGLKSAFDPLTPLVNAAALFRIFGVGP